MQDKDIIRELHQVRNATFITRDSDFYKRKWLHRGYCIIYLTCPENKVAEVATHVVRHSEFNTHAKRMGKVIRASSEGITYMQINLPEERTIAW